MADLLFPFPPAIFLTVKSGRAAERPSRLAVGVGRSPLVLLLLFLLGLGLPLAGGYYSKMVSSLESNKGSLEFPPDREKKVKPAVIDVARFGWPKRVFQPWRVRVYTSVANNSREPRRVGVVLEGCHLPARWHVTDYTWDEASRALREPLRPGGNFGVYIFFTIPEEERHKPVICEGRILAVDPTTGETLAFLPLKLLNSAAGPVRPSPRGSGGPGGEAVPDGAIHNH
jgi:hypothetical protein